MPNFTIKSPIKVVPSARAIFPTLNSVGWINDFNHLNTDAGLIAAISGGSGPLDFTNDASGGSSTTSLSVSGNIKYTYDLSTPVIDLGAPLGVVSYNSLPSGFTVRTAILKINTILLTESGSPSAVSATLTINFANNNVTLTTPDGISMNGGLPVSLSGAGFSQAPSMLDILLTGFGFNVNLQNSTLNSTTIQITISSTTPITGAYDIISTSWTLPTTTAKAGDKITINANTSLGAGIAGVSSLHIQYNDGNPHDIQVLAQDFIFQSDTQIIFYWPEFGNFNGTVFLYVDGLDPTIPLPDIPISRRVLGSGSQFTGRVLVGALTVTFADASGIYTLIQNKTSDTVYNPASRGTTTDVAILDPFIKTGFLP